jgi:hypothetical protein
LCHFIRKDSYTYVRQYIALLFYIIIWCDQKCVAGNVIKNCSIYCVMSVCSCVVMVWKVCIFSAVMCSRMIGVVLVWRVATLPISCYIVRKITTRSVPQSYAGYLTTLQPLVHGVSFLWYLRPGTTKAWIRVERKY